jgi:probable HAF family extracellular repeat protein
MYIGTPSNTNSFLGVGINDSGQIAGTAGSFNSAQAFLYSEGVFHNLGTLPGDYSSAADGISNAGQVVGNSDGASGSHPFLYSNGTMQALGSLAGGGGLAYAEGISNNGEVWGTSATSGGSIHAFLYTGGQMLDLTNMLHSLSSSISQYSSYTVEGINSQGQILVQAWNSATDYRSFLLTPEGQPLPTAPDTVQVVPIKIGSDPVQAPEPSALALLIGGIIAYGARRGMRRTPSLA